MVIERFIEQEEYPAVTDRIQKQEVFPLPKMTILNKKNSNKKRTVFTFPREENYVLKLIAYLLLEYDGIFMPNLYSFRKKMGAKKAIIDLVTYKGIDEMFSYKVDLQDYFNSVNAELLLSKLREVLKEEEDLYQFIEGILKNPYAVKDRESWRGFRFPHFLRICI